MQKEHRVLLYFVPLQGFIRAALLAIPCMYSSDNISIYSTYSMLESNPGLHDTTYSIAVEPQPQNQSGGQHTYQ